MTYGVSSLDLAKVVVLLSCVLNVAMPIWIAVDPAAVIASPEGGGWWDVLQRLSTERTHMYPRIWSTSLLMTLVVRVNWCFTVEICPPLYRCVLLSYVIPFVHYMLEAYFFETIPPFDLSMGCFMLIPWACILVHYKKYTKE